MSGTDPGALLRISGFLGDQDARASESLEHWVLESRHPDGEHWVALRRYRSRQEGEDAVRRLVEEGGIGEPDHYRVRKVRRGEGHID